MSLFKKIFGGFNSTNNTKQEDLTITERGLTREELNEISNEIMLAKERGPARKFPIKYNDIRTFNCYNQSYGITEELERILPSHSGPIEVDKLKTIVGENFEIESMTQGERDFIFDANVYEYPILRKDYLKKVAYRLYDELLHSNKVFTNYIHFGNDFSKFGLDRAHYITNITNGRFYFTNEIATLIREHIMAEVFHEKLISLKEGCSPIAAKTPFLSRNEFKYVKSMYPTEIFNSNVEKEGLKNKTFTFATRSEKVLSDNEHLKFKECLYIDEFKDIKSSNFLKKGSNQEIINTFNEASTLFSRMKVYNPYSNQKQSTNKILDFIAPGIELLYGKDICDKLCEIIKDTDYSLTNDSTELNFNFVFKSLIEQFKHYYTNARSLCIKNDFNAILSGAKGESAVSRHLELYDDEMIILDNLTIGFKGKTAECDSILITKFGIFVIECKNFGKSGNFSINIASDGAWSRVYINEATNKKTVVPLERSATIQNIEHARILQRALKDLLGDKFSERFNVKDFVVISNDIVQINNNSDQKVFRISSIYNHISKFKEKISEDEFEFLKKSILKCTVESKKFEYFDYKEEYLHLLQSVLSYFDNYGGFKKLVEKNYRNINNRSTKKIDLIREFCKVEAQLSYIYKNYDKQYNTPLLTASQDPFQNGELDRSIDKFIDDLHSHSLNKSHPVIPGDSVYLSPQLHSDVLTSMKRTSWEICERYFYPSINDNGVINWSDNYFAKFNDINKIDIMNSTGLEILGFIDSSSIPSNLNRSTQPKIRSIAQNNISSSIVGVLVKSRFTSYYFKPKHIYKDLNKSLDKLKEICLGSSISLGNSTVTLKERPIYDKTAILFLLYNIDFGKFADELDLNLLSKKDYTLANNCNWFSMIYDRRVDFLLRSLHTSSTKNNISQKDFDTLVPKFAIKLKNKDFDCEANDTNFNTEVYSEDNSGAFTFSCKI